MNEVIGTLREQLAKAGRPAGTVEDVAGKHDEADRRGGPPEGLDSLVEKILADQAVAKKRAPMARMLHRQFGRFPSGQRPELRRKMFSKLERLAADPEISDAIWHIVEEVIEDSAECDNPANYFAASIMRRIQDRGVLVERCQRRVKEMPPLPASS